jgi:hypothetical protein
MSERTRPAEPAWTHERRGLGAADALAVAVWTAAIAWFFRDALFGGQALFYFDITEINYPYRDFLARGLRLGQVWRWAPGFYCGLPLYAESQAGYWHPLKFLLYPWMSTWRAFNLDTILSVWLTGLATYGWLRGHVGAAGSLTGAGLFALSGFVWAHLIHTSMTNALISVPLAFWALESAWEGGRLRGVALGALALACQVFAGHLQDTILTGGALGIYAVYRAVSGRGGRSALAFAVLLGGLGIGLAAVQWLPSKNLLDRSPRAGGLTWEQLTYGSWAPELLPTLLVREAYGTRARDTDWMDGYYPYHEMNAYMGVIGLALAVVGAAAYRERWVGFWVILAGLGGLFMLGRYTCVFDFMNQIPVIGSARIPVRYHLWLSLAVAALAAVGVDRLSRPGVVRLRPALLAVGVLLIVSAVILVDLYVPAFTEARRWSTPEHLEHFRWLWRELGWAGGRTVALAVAALWFAVRATRDRSDTRRAGWAAALPALVLVDLLSAHAVESPTIDPSYWTTPPASARRILAEPDHGRVTVLGFAAKSAGEPGYASRKVDFFEVRDDLAWGLPSVWGLESATGVSPIYPRRLLTFQDSAVLPARYQVEGVTHLMAARPLAGLTQDVARVGSTFVYRLPGVLPRARLMGRPVYVGSETDAGKALVDLGPAIRDRLIVEDADRPLATDAVAEGTATIELDQPERVEIEVDARTPAYLVLADTFDPGWSVTIDNQPALIRPAYAGLRAVFVRPGKHRVIFTYEPAGFRMGLLISGVAAVLALGCLVWPRPVATPSPAHGSLAWLRFWPLIYLGVIALVILGSAFRIEGRTLKLHARWENAWHRFSWANDIQAIEPMKGAVGR